MMMWPDLDELKQVLNLNNGDEENTDWDTVLEPVLASAIRKVQHDVGVWDEYEDLPDDALSRAALRMAELMALRPDSASEADKDPVYRMHLFGHRKRFGIG